MTTTTPRTSIRQRVRVNEEAFLLQTRRTALLARALTQLTQATPVPPKALLDRLLFHLGLARRRNLFALAFQVREFARKALEDESWKLPEEAEDHKSEAAALT